MEQATGMTILKKAPLFWALNDAAVRGFVSQCQTLKLPAGRSVFRPGQEVSVQPAGAQGRCKKVFKTRAGREKATEIFLRRTHS